MFLEDDDSSFEIDDEEGGYYSEEDEVDFGEDEQGVPTVVNLDELHEDLNNPVPVETPQEVEVEAPTPENKSTDDDETDPFKQVTNNAQTMAGIQYMQMSSIKRVVVEEEPDVPTVDLLDTPTHQVAKGQGVEETTEQVVEVVTPQPTSSPIPDIFNMGLEIKQPDGDEGTQEQVQTQPQTEADILNAELDDVYKQAESTATGSSPVTTENPQGGTENAESDIESEYYIFGRVLGDAPDRDVYRKELMLEFTKNNIFQDEFYVLYRLLHDYPRITPTKIFIQTYLQNHQSVYLNLPQVNVNKFRLGDNDPYAEFVASCVYTLEKCEKLDVEDNDFYTHLEIKKMTHINIESIKTFSEATQILTEGLGTGKYAKKGYTDMRRHINQSFTELDNLVHKTNRKGAIVYGKTVLDEDEGVGGILFKFGIKALDEALGGLNRGMMLSLLAPPKGFKTRLSTYILHQAIIQGVNSLVWSLENGYKGVECLIRSRHFYWYYQEHGLNNDGRLDINAKDIMDGVLSPEVAELEEASWVDLQTNPNYGTFVNMDATFDYSTFEATLEEQIKLENIEFILLDYLQLVEDTGGGGQMKNERVSSTYQKTLRLIKNFNISGLMPGQIKQNVINDLSRLKEEELEDYELRDAGAESSETIRTPDINVMIYGTKRMISEGKSYLLSVPSRYSKPFPPIKLAVKAQHCTFASVPSDAW